jgi:hypothetical protein
LETFKNRGNNDYFGSHDLEDIIAVIDGRTEIVDEILQSNQEIKNYLASSIQELMQNNRFLDALPGHLDYGPLQHERTQIVLTRIKAIAGLT